MTKGSGRASEKLAVPVFSGEDTDDIGSSARSYLRQIEAWRRMTYLPPSQQGLVLYQSLTGKAWIAAEELSVPRLAAEGGVSYFVSWVNSRFLDLEVARIGKAFSDFFRRLRRRPGQSIREYNSEYDRLHARLREVGCSLPQECAAWLYIDRLQLEEPQELNLLASVGNEYNLSKLQRAAVLHDRSHRKPWETGRTRKPHTTHVTDAAEDDVYEDHNHYDEADIDLEDGVPEEVAVAFATYQSAKERYKEQTKARGFHGGRGPSIAKDGNNKGELTRDEKVKLMKSRSFCSSCGKKGHWHRDPECPNSGSSKGVKEVEMLHHVPAEVFSLRHEGASLLGITDTACAKAVAGTMWLQQYSDALEKIHQRPDLIRESEAFKFGTGKIHHSSFHVVVCFRLGQKVVEMKTSIINGDVPLLMSKQALAQLGMIYDIAENRADFTRVGIRNFDLVTTSSGHPAIPIIPAKPSSGPERLVIGADSAQSGSQYMAFAVSYAGTHGVLHTRTPGPSTTTQHATTSSTQSSTPPVHSTSTTKAPPYKIFYDKKLNPEVKELLTQDRLQSVSFMKWWEGTKVNDDFWLESEHAWHRIHVVPRRALCNPSTWKTQHSVQKYMLLESIGNLRITEGFCCRSSKPLETVVDRWKDEQSENSFRLLWVGRSTFAKSRSANPTSEIPPLPRHGMQASRDLEDDEVGVALRGCTTRAGGAPELDRGGDQGDHHGAPYERPGLPAGDHHEVGDEPHPHGAQSQGQGAPDRLPGQDHQRKPTSVDQGCYDDARLGAHEDRQVQRVRVQGDPTPVRDVGGPRSENEPEPALRACPIRQVVGAEGVRDPLRERGHVRGERDGSVQGRDQQRLQRRSILSSRWMGQDQRCEGDCTRHGQTNRSTDRPEDFETRVVECGIRPASNGDDGVRDRPADVGGDPRLGDSARGPEAEGEGGPGADEDYSVKSTNGTLAGNLAPTKVDNPSEDDVASRGLRGHRGGDDQLPERDDHCGRVCPAPHDLRPQPRDGPQEYEHVGSQFGSKTSEREQGCCGREDAIMKGDAYLTGEEFEIAAKDAKINYECNRATGEEQDAFSVAYENQDYTHETLLRLLSSLDYNPVKATRDGVFGGKTGDMVKYFTYGLFTHGGVVGITNRTREQDNVVRYLNGYAKHHLNDNRATWTSISVSYNTNTEVHHDYHNAKGTKNFSVSVGQQQGGGLWLEDKTINEDTPKDGVKWRRTGRGHWLPGRVHDTHNQFYEFDPFLKHATEPWTGTRWSITYHTTRNIDKAGEELRKFLKKCGFPLPRKTFNRAVPEAAGTKPRPSTRRAIFNNAAKIGVMMATLITAANNYMTEQVLPHAEPEPIVLFEIGGTEATQEAVAIGKDVFEPMSWERYRDPDGKTNAYHIVNGGGPKELRLTLDGKPEQCNESLVELVRQQLDDGGTVVISGATKDSIFYDIKNGLDYDKMHEYHHEAEGRTFMVMFKKKGGTQAIRCRDRVHEVRMVSNGGEGDQVREQPLTMGAGGITFGKDTPATVATALRRLHQNLGHPRQEDLLRHLRLAGCDTPILKAARSMRCQVCDANAAPKIARPSTIPPMIDFNDTLGLDLFFCHDVNDVKHAFLSVTDYGTSYHLATRVDGQSTEDIEARFNDVWLLPFGPPKSVVIDLEGGLQAALGRLCDWHGIGVRSVATQSHWQAGVVERQQAWWKHIWDKVTYQLSVGEEEVDMVVPIINSAKNDLRRRCGYSPSQWVFGKAPRVPEDLQDPDGGGHVLWDVSEDAKYQRQAATRAAARVAFYESQTDNRLRKALLQRTRVAARPLDVGESVHFWHKPKNRRRGCWSGPAVIVGKEGGNYWVSKGGRCRLTSAEHLRPTTAEEVGALLSMKNTQREVEMLLDHDPDGEDAYESNEEEHLERMLEDISGGEDDLPQEPGDIDQDDEEMPILEPFENDDSVPPIPPTRRLKRKTAVADLDGDQHEAMMTKTQLTTRGLEKRKEKELRWAEIPAEVHQKFRDAEVTQWKEHLDYDALQPLSLDESCEVRKRVPADRILRSRWAYRDKNYARRREGEDVPWRCKSRLVIAGHTDPDLNNDAIKLTTDAPTLSRSGLACLLQRTADGLRDEDPWGLAAGDIRCAFLTGSYLTRELYMHQPKTGFPGMVPGQLVKIKKNVFGLATSPHTWWQDLQNGVKKVEIRVTLDNNDIKMKFDQSPMDPCVFMLREFENGNFKGKPVAYLGCHVDDLLIAGPGTLQEHIQKALSGVFPIETWEAQTFEFLGSKISVEGDVVTMTQEKYAETRLFTLDLPTGVNDDDLAPPELISDNRSLIGALSWMSAQSRPDLTCSVSMAQQLQKAPTYGDLKFTNAIATKAYQFRERGLEFKGIPEGRLMFVVFHDAAWANVPEPDPEENYYVLTVEEDEIGRQKEGPYAAGAKRRAKRGNSKVASQLGVLVTFTDRCALAGRPGHCNIGDWRSRAGQRICRSTFGAETQACAEGLETAQYLRSMYETIVTGRMVAVDEAVLPILCLSDCRSLYDHLNRQGIPRVPSDKRLAVDLAALRQGLRSEKWNDSLPIGWIPGVLQKGDILTKPQNPSEWWEKLRDSLLLPLSIGTEGVLINNRVIRHRTSVKLECSKTVDGVYPFEYCM